MLRSILILLLFSAGVTSAQQTVDNSGVSSTAAAMLDGFIDMRAEYKHSSTKEFSRDEQLAMDDWCYAMEKKFPDAYETSYAWHVNDHYSDGSGEKIKDAYKKAPNDKRVVKEMFGYYVMKDEISSANSMLLKVSSYYSKNTLNYYRDVMPTQGVIITSSIEDAIPLYILQLKDKLGKEAVIVNMDFLINKGYLQKQVSKLGAGSQSFYGNEKAYLKLVMNKNKQVHLSSTVSQNYLKGNAQNCFLTGLSYQSNPASHVASLEKFWKEVAQKNFSSLSLTSSEKRLYTNYLPPLLTLYKLQLARGGKNETLKKAIIALADKVQQTKNVKDILNTYE